MLQHKPLFLRDLEDLQARLHKPSKTHQKAQGEARGYKSIFGDVDTSDDVVSDFMGGFGMKK